MQSAFKFVVSPYQGKQYNDTKKVGDVELIICNSIEEAIDVSRVAVIESLPLNYKGNVKVGDLAIVNHNIFRINFDHKGIPLQSEWYISENKFAISSDMIYMIVREGEFIPTDDNVFVLPMRENDFWLGEIESENVGFAKYVNDDLKSKGVTPGSRIAFKQGSKYIFEIFGEKLFMMKSRRIVAKLN